MRIPSLLRSPHSVCRWRNAAHEVWAAKKSFTMDYRFLPGFCSVWVACGRTLKASHHIAQGKRSGVAAKRHPGFGFNDPCFNPVRVAQTVVEPFQGSRFFPNRQPRAALRLPWALLFNRFAVIDID